MGHLFRLSLSSTPSYSFNVFLALVRMAILTFGKLFFFVFLLTLNFCNSSSFYTEETPLKLFSVHWGASRFNLSESEFRISLENGVVSSILIKKCNVHVLIPTFGKSKRRYLRFWNLVRGYLRFLENNTRK